MWLKNNEIVLPAQWQELLSDELDRDYIKSLLDYLNDRQNLNIEIYPSSDNCFNAFQLTPVDKVSVVILGQDPYHGPGQAHGLSFSVAKGVPLPPSLKNIYKELESDLSVPLASHGCLESWAKQGVFLLNSVLTVERSAAAAHQGKGWEQFTDKVISVLNDSCQSLVFLLWGAYAQKKAHFVDREKHYVLEGPHPSPLSAYRGFLGCKHFSKANDYLLSQNKRPINWMIK